MTFASLLLLLGAVFLGLVFVVGFTVATLLLSFKWLLKELREDGFYD